MEATYSTGIESQNGLYWNRPLRSSSSNVKKPILIWHLWSRVGIEHEMQ